MEKPKLNELLDRLIPEYGEYKRQSDELEKLCKEKNAAIKSIMQDYALQHYEAEGYKIVYSVQERTSINEEALLEMAHKYNALRPCIKKKEYIDYDALEKRIYDGDVPDFILQEIDAKAKQVKKVPTLKITKLKEKKDGKNNDNQSNKQN